MLFLVAVYQKQHITTEFTNCAIFFSIMVSSTLEVIIAVILSPEFSH